MTTRSQLLRTLSANLSLIGFEGLDVVGATYAFGRHVGESLQALLLTIIGRGSSYLNVRVAVRFETVQVVLDPLFDLPELANKKSSIFTLCLPLDKLSPTIPRSWMFHDGDNGADLALTVLRDINIYALPYLEQLDSVASLHHYLQRDNNIEVAFRTRSQGLGILLATSYLLDDQELTHILTQELEAGKLRPSDYVEKLRRLASHLRNSDRLMTDGPRT